MFNLVERYSGSSIQAKSGKATTFTEKQTDDNSSTKVFLCTSGRSIVDLQTIYGLPSNVYQSICSKLNEPLPGKDFKALADLLGYSAQQTERLQQSANPADVMLFLWATQDGNELKKFIEILKKMERNDVVEILESKDKIVKDSTEDAKESGPGHFPQYLRFSVDQHRKSVSFPAASAFLHFPADAVEKPGFVTLSRVRHKDCEVKARNGDVFCSSIVKIELEGYTFDKPATVLLSHCAAQDGAYADYYELTMQKLDKEWKDLETEQLSKPEDISEEMVANFYDIHNCLPFAQASITETSTVVATTRIRSEEIVLVPDEMYVYPRSYGNECDLEIFFPVGAVAEECRLTVQVLPVSDVLDVSTISKDKLIHLPVLKVSGQDKPFLEPVEVLLGYSSPEIADLDDNFLPIGEKLPFTSKYGVLLRSHKEFDGKQNWENVHGDETALVERSQKDRLEISFCVDHFCMFCLVLTRSEDVKADDVASNETRHDETYPSLRAVCLAAHEKVLMSRQKVSAVIAPVNKLTEVKKEWGSTGEKFNELLKHQDEIFFCVPVNDGHLDLPDNNIRFFTDDVNSRYNVLARGHKPVIGLDMRFLRTECADNQHNAKNCMGKCVITPKKVVQEVSCVKEIPVSERAVPLETNDFSATTSTSNSSRHTSLRAASTSRPDDQTTMALEVMKNRCEFFEKQVTRLSGKTLKLDGQKKESRTTKIFSVAGPVTTILIGIGGGLAIAMGVPTFGIGSAFAGAAVAAATLTVKKMDDYNNRKTVSILKDLCNDCNVDELKKVDPVSVILAILNEVGKELSRIFEAQLFRLEHDKDVFEMACCAVNLMLKLKADEEFSRNALLKKVLLGKTKSKHLKTKRNNKTWQVPDVFQKPGLRKEIPTSDFSSVIFEYRCKTNDSCDWETYGYRGEILEISCKTTNNELEARKSNSSQPCVGDNDETGFCCRVDTDGINEEINFFVECNIDKEFTESCLETNQYQPFHCVVRCPSILKNFALSGGNPSKPSLSKHISKMYYSCARPVKIVYRPHSPRILHSLSNTDLSRSDFSHVNFTGSSLKDCVLTECTILFGEMKEVNLCGSKFKTAHLSHCNLTGAQAQRCEWTATKVLHSCVHKADLRGGQNTIGGNNWDGTPLDTAQTGVLPGENEPLANQPGQTELAEIKKEDKNGIAENCRNNNPLLMLLLLLLVSILFAYGSPSV